MNDNIEVSIYCLTYNHEKYIEQTLNGFINQKTSFKFEVIVHDDASTDNTTEIIKRFAAKYPNIIRPIYQKENQYSKGTSIVETYISPNVRATKYYGVCEGDDYWTDEFKLQKQYEYLEQHPECSLCVHNTKRISENGNDLDVLFNNCKLDQEYTTIDVIKAGGGGLFHTSSFFWRKEYGLVIPKDFQIKGIGDYNRAIYLSTCGTVHYLGSVMSAYRVGSTNSWVSRTAADKQRLLSHYSNLIDGLQRINKVTDLKFNDAFSSVIDKYRFTESELKGDYSKIIHDKSLKRIYKQKSLIYKVKFVIKCLAKC